MKKNHNYFTQVCNLNADLLKQLYSKIGNSEFYRKVIVFSDIIQGQMNELEILIFKGL